MKKFALALLFFCLPALAADLRVSGTFSSVPQPGAGSIMRSNGTSWIGSTATYPTTCASTNFVYANGTNTITCTPFITFSGAVFQFAGDNPAADLTYAVTHTGANSASRAVSLISQGGASGGDALTTWTITGGQSYSAGVDISDSSKWKLSRGTALGTTDALIIDSAGAVSVPGALTVTGALTATVSNATTATNVSGGTGSVTTLASSGLYTPTGGIKGKTGGTDATAGNVGEYIASTFTATNFAATNVFSDQASISLTAGDWDVSVNASVNPNTATATTFLVFIGLVSGDNTTGLARGDNSAEGQILATVLTSGSVPSYRISVSGTTTVYYKARAQYTVNTPTIAGRISARRVQPGT